MKSYEAVFVFRTEDELFKKGRELVKEELARVEATVTKEEDMGARELAYPVKKETRGHYYLYETDLAPDRLADLTNSLRLVDPVLKYVFVRK